MAGHYSPYIEHNGVIYISGQLPINPTSMEIPNEIKTQTEAVLNKLDKILIEAGSSKYNVLQVRIYITNADYWDDVNEVYANYFGEYRPARCIVPVPSLHFGCKIELEAIAAKII